MALVFTIFGIGIMGFGQIVPQHQVVGLIFAIIGVILSVVGK